MQDEEDDLPVAKRPAASPPKKRREAEKIVIPRRQLSVVIPPKEIIYPSPDKTTCAECPCFPKDAPYRKPAKLRPCLTTPLTLYELAAPVVDRLRFPEAFQWSTEDVAKWMEDIGLPEYMESIIDNKINGRRLLILEQAWHLPPIGIHNFDHVQIITSKVRELFSTEFIKFSRSIGLPLRKPLTHCTWFKSRTGPTWGIRTNWTRCDVLRAMEIIMPEPLHLDHWDSVWYQKPDFPKVKFARIPKRERVDDIPHYKEVFDPSREIQVPRKFRIDRLISKDQLIWMQEVDYPPLFPKEVKRPRKPSRLDPKPVKCEGLRGRQLLLARRKMNKAKFLPDLKPIQT